MSIVWLELFAILYKTGAAKSGAKLRSPEPSDTISTLTAGIAAVTPLSVTVKDICPRLVPTVAV